MMRISWLSSSFSQYPLLGRKLQQRGDGLTSMEQSMLHHMGH